jgi:hypothetical protein
MPANLIVSRHPVLPPPPEVIEGKEEYLVEEILDSKIFCGRLKFKIKWEGYIQTRARQTVGSMLLTFMHLNR